jgi:hypothetical protein
MRRQISDLIGQNPHLKPRKELLDLLISVSFISLLQGVFLIKKGEWQKEGKEAIHPLYKLKGIINADPPLRISRKGVGGWQRREKKPSTDH